MPSSIKPRPTSRSPCDDITLPTKKEGVVSWSCRGPAYVMKIRHVSHAMCRCSIGMPSIEKVRGKRTGCREVHAKTKGFTSGPTRHQLRPNYLSLTHFKVLTSPLFRTEAAHSENQQSTSSPSSAALTFPSRPPSFASLFSVLQHSVASKVERQSKR